MSKQGKIVTPSEDEVSAYGGESDQKTDPGGPAAPDAANTQNATGSEADDWREKFLRAKAEMANYQKRAEKDRSEAMRYAHAELARALLPIVDDLDRLIASASEQKSSLAALVEGVRLSRENFLKVLQQFHVLPIEAHGQPFDPNVHQALMQQPSEQHEEHPIVLQEVARGYRLHDRVLRPAKVIVSKSLGVSPKASSG